MYVDDIYKCGPGTTLIDAINKQYPLKHLGEAQVIIGMKIQQSDAHTKIHQQQYIENVITQLQIPINTNQHTNGNHLCKTHHPSHIQKATHNIPYIHRNYTIPSRYHKTRRSIRRSKIGHTLHQPNTTTCRRRRYTHTTISIQN
eukprot:Pgem_evm2s16798